MPLQLTKGGLAPAKIINLSTQEEVRFMFNPYEYTISKSNTWEKESGKGMNVPRHNFKSGGSQTLSLTLHFDSQVENKDVRGYTDTLWKMMMVEEQASSTNQRSGKSAPPAVAFQWGRLYFKAIILNMSQKFTLFKADGTPLRCTVDISLEQHLDENEFLPQMEGQSSGQEAPGSTTVVQGDRLDHIAGANGGDHRQIAENNNIDNPLQVAPGTSLKV